MTPFDCASLSLNGSELPPPTVGGSPLISGGHAAPAPGDGLAGCASDVLAPATIDERGDERDCNAQNLLLTFSHGLCQRGKAPGRSRPISRNEATLAAGQQGPPLHAGTGREYLQLRPNKRTCSGRNVLHEQTPSFIPSAAERA